MRPESPAFLILLAMLVAIGPLSTDLYLPSLPTLVAVFDASTSEVQLTLSVFLMGFATCQLVYGPLSDRFGRKPILIVGLSIFVAASAACALASSIEALIALRLMQAVGACSAGVVSRAVVRDLFDRRNAARMLAYSGALMGLAPAIAPLIGAYILVWIGWEANFFVVALWGGGLILIVSFGLKESNTAPDHLALLPIRMFANVRRLLSSRIYTGYALTNSAVFSGLFAFISGSSFVLIDVLEIPPVEFGYYFALGVFGYMLGTGLSGRIGSRVNTDKLIRIAACMAALSGCTMAAFALMGVPSVWAIVGPMTAYMIAFGTIMPQSTASALGPFPEVAGLASAVLGFLQMTLGSLVGVIVGISHNNTTLPLAVVIAGTGLATLAAHIRVGRLSSQTETETAN
ncbi:MAG: Bcr/CflA family drug resistance efflux transporter [Alphaproteobacteria bacterium]|nr:Bcr/CflA family drug resistance efflux transporter [Alphaproteobacteria bacterium]|tara:strand:+ start:5501 stop:6706 length:1206 start_codon:yes stop_codon:yes gene_type:complete